MKIDIESPFSYRLGYLRVTKSGRKLVDMVNSEKDRTTISYARYLFCVKLGFVIDPELEVDHIDGDCSNDSVENLQILTKKDHAEKTNLDRRRSITILTCPYCYEDFERYTNQIKKGTTPKCSRSCNARYSRLYCGWTGKS